MTTSTAPRHFQPYDGESPPLPTAASSAASTTSSKKSYSTIVLLMGIAMGCLLSTVLHQRASSSSSSLSLSNVGFSDIQMQGIHAINKNQQPRQYRRALAAEGGGEGEETEASEADERKPPELPTKTDGEDERTEDEEDEGETRSIEEERADKDDKGESSTPGLKGHAKTSSSTKDDTTTASTPTITIPHFEEPLDEISKGIIAQHETYAKQSIPTPMSPHVMRTETLPDHHRKKILVTGGAGFVGSHLVDKLMMQGHEVTVADNFFTGQKKNIAHWLHHPNFNLIVHDVTEPLTLEVDQIYHLACPASPPHYQYNPVKTIKTSTMGTLNMLGLAKRVRARVLLTSTSEIYGDPQVHPQHESYWGNVNTIGPRSCYDEGKRVAETMMYSYRNQNNVDVRVARIFNTFGPRMHPNDGRVVSNFIIQSLQNKNLTIYGEGLQTRSFQYVSDLVEGLHALMNGNYDMPVNLGNPDEYSVKDFAQYIKDMTNSKSNIVFLPKSQDDPSQRRPDISTAKKEIGWSPKVKVEEGLKETIKYFSRVLNEAGEIIPTGPGAAKPEA